MIDRVESASTVACFTVTDSSVSLANTMPTYDELMHVSSAMLLSYVNDMK